MPVSGIVLSHSVCMRAEGALGRTHLNCVLANCAHHDVEARHSQEKLTVTYTGLDRDQQRASRCCRSRSLPGCWGSRVCMAFVFTR